MVVTFYLILYNFSFHGRAASNVEIYLTFRQTLQLLSSGWMCNDCVFWQLHRQREVSAVIDVMMLIGGSTPVLVNIGQEKRTHYKISHAFLLVEVTAGSSHVKRLKVRLCLTSQNCYAVRAFPSMLQILYQIVICISPSQQNISAARIIALSVWSERGCQTSSKNKFRHVSFTCVTGASETYSD